MSSVARTAQSILLGTKGQVLSHHALLVLSGRTSGRKEQSGPEDCGPRSLASRPQQILLLEKDLKESFSGSPLWELVFS